MDERNEINLIWIHNDSVKVSEEYENQKHLDNHSIDVKSCETIFPWLNKFNKIMCSSVGHRSYQLLKHLLSLYTQNILTSINTYCEKALDIIRLKNHLSNTLTFFHLYWHDIKEHVGDYNSYLNEMSVLLGIYIDIELKTFKHTMDSSKIASKLLSALWIYLSNSEKHIFRVLLKLKLATRKHSKICDLIFMRSFTSLRKNVESLTDVDYVRYLLALKMWKRIRENVEEKKEVNKMALTILGPYIPKMRDELLKIIPKPPTEHENKTIWLLQSNIFDLKTACNNFVILEETTSEFKDMYLINTSDLNFQSSQKNKMDNAKNHFFENETKNSKINNKLLTMEKRNKFKKYKKMSKLKPGEVVLIDLTEEDELRIDKKKKKKKSNRNLEWLKMMKKKYKVQKKDNEIKCRNQVQIADAHSTGNSGNITPKILLEHLPISDNKVSESTETCTLMEQKSVQDHTYYNSHDHCNKKNNELKCMLHKQYDTCISTLKQTDTQRNKVLYLLKLLSTVAQNIKEPKTILSFPKENREENMSSQKTLYCKNIANESSVINTQGKEESFSQSKSSIETVFLSKECQNNTTNVQSIKRELPTNADCNVTEGDTYCQNDAVYTQNDCYSHDFRSMNNHNGLQLTKNMKPKLYRDTHEYTNCCKKIEVKPFPYYNNGIFNMIKNEDATQNTIDNSTTDKKSICDKNIMCMLSDLDKCMDVLNRIGEHIMTVHAEKQRLECLDKDVCAVSTTVLGDQCVESSSDWIQNINSLTNTEKFSRILELCGNKDLLNVRNYQDFYKWDKQDGNAILNRLKCESDNCQKVTVSTSQPKECSCGRDNTFLENTPLSFICNHVKSEFEQSIKQEKDENFEFPSDKVQKTSQYKLNTGIDNEIYDNESFIHNNDIKESNQDVQWESTIQNFSQKGNMTKSCSVDEFENIDILDSILNGDITIEDEKEIWQDSQSSLISPINYDNSNSVLNCITEFFSQSDLMHTNGGDEKCILSDMESSQKSLPEGSLGTTGILNSLFDFDLTNMDSPSNDFIYSSVQAVNPRLIKKTFEDTSKLLCEDAFTVEKNDLENTFVQKEKELCNQNNRNHSIDSSVDVVGFGLNKSRDEPLQFSSLIKSTPLFSGQSTVLVNSDNISSEEKESFPKCSLSSPTDKFYTSSIIEKSYIFQKNNTINQVQLFNDTNKDLPEICTSNDIQSNTSMSYMLSQQEDDVQSSHKYTRVELETSPMVIKKSSSTCDLLSSTDLMSCSTETALQYEKQKYENSLKQRNIQNNVQHNCKKEQNYITKHKTEISAQSRSSKQTLKCKKKIKMKQERKNSPSSTTQPIQNELNLTKCSQITNVDPLNYQDEQKSSQPVYTANNISKQLKHVGIQQLRNISGQKQQILLNYHKDSMVDTIYKKDPKLEISQCTTEDNILEDPNMSCISEKSHEPKSNFITDKDATEVSNNSVKSIAKWSLHNTNTQSSKFIKEQVITTVEEDTPLKKRKLTSKFSQTFTPNAVICSVNQQKVKNKHFISTKKGMVCTNRRKHVTGKQIDI